MTFALDGMTATKLRYEVRVAVNELRSAKHHKFSPAVIELRKACLTVRLQTYMRATRARSKTSNRS